MFCHFNIKLKEICRVKLDIRAVFTNITVFVAIIGPLGFN